MRPDQVSLSVMASAASCVMPDQFLSVTIERGATQDPPTQRTVKPLSEEGDRPADFCLLRQLDAHLFDQHFHVFPNVTFRAFVAKQISGVVGNNQPRALP